jgi:sirohydrochlorin cobaltochelatase
MSAALVLAGHGSQKTPETAGAIWRHVDALRANGVADEVAACFWKEPPGFATVLQSLESDEVFIVPVFTSQGFFTQQVLPAEFGFEPTGDGLRTPDGRKVVYTPTLGASGLFDDRIDERVNDGLRRLGVSASESAIVLIGHGARGNADSRGDAVAQSQRVQQQFAVRESAAVFLDDEPSIPDTFRLTTAPNLVAVPYFFASGSHVTDDVPRALGLQPGQTDGMVQGRRVVYAPPVGEDAELWRDLLALARRAGLPKRSNPGTSWACFPSYGRRRLINVVRAAGALEFGQLHLTMREVRRTGDSTASEILDLATLRRIVRDDPFRPLLTFDDLPDGWYVPIESGDQLHAVVETVYPGAVADWAAGRSGTLAVRNLSKVAARQVGMFRELDQLTVAQQEAIVQSECGHCIRHPTWFANDRAETGIPCPEPCNLWMSKAKEAMDARRTSGR